LGHYWTGPRRQGAGYGSFLWSARCGSAKRGAQSVRSLCCDCLRCTVQTRQPSLNPAARWCRNIPPAFLIPVSCLQTMAQAGGMGSAGPVSAEAGLDETLEDYQKVSHTPVYFPRHLNDMGDQRGCGWVEEKRSKSQCYSSLWGGQCGICFVRRPACRSASCLRTKRVVGLGSRGWGLEVVGGGQR